jgi:2,3-dihydroxy-p-cumate/2,3-dihydroxybenzoate 3,4-dioxygenase
MIHLHDIRYVRIGTPNLDAAQDYATKILGLQLVCREGKAAYFRGDKAAVRGDTRDHTLVYFEGDPADHTIGFELQNAEDLDRAAHDLEKAGFRVTAGTSTECERRRVNAFASFRDPSGNKIEMVGRPFHTGFRFFPGRDAGITEFNHIGLFTTDAIRDQKFWTAVCNARVSDWIGDAPLLRVNTCHHTLALLPASRGGIQHINHQVEDIDDLMRSYYFLKERGVRIVFGPGRHPLSGAVMLYFSGPDRMVYEYSVGVRHISKNEEESYRPRQFPYSSETFCMWGSKVDAEGFGLHTGTKLAQPEVFQVT